jgi:hypothetical protein
MSEQTRMQLPTGLAGCQAVAFAFLAPLPAPTPQGRLPAIVLSPVLLFPLKHLIPTREPETQNDSPDYTHLLLCLLQLGILRPREVKELDQGPTCHSRDYKCLCCASLWGGAEWVRCWALPVGLSSPPALPCEWTHFSLRLI